MEQRCIGCDARYPLEQVLYTCDACGEILEIALDARKLRGVKVFGTGVWRYAPFIPADVQRWVTLGEGATGLHRLARLEKQLGILALHLKNEGENPTGSFKDRGMTVGVTHAVEIGARAVACASTGNTSASLAAYAARAGMQAVVLVPGGKIALGKLAQAMVHGARIVQIEGNFDDAMRLVRELSLERGEVYLLNSINPFRLEGQKTIAFEICEALEEAPDAVVLPLGNAGNISAIWKGFREMLAAGWITRLPRLIGVQAEGAAPVARFIAGELAACRVDEPDTVATAIRIGAPVSWRKALAAVKESGGSVGMVSDAQLLAAQRRLAETEGFFVEPASAVPIAWLAANRIDAQRVVVVTTGHGLKDPEAVLRAAPEIRPARPTLSSLQEALRD